MRVGGAARLYAEPSAEEDLRTLLVEAAASSVPIFMLGRGSNLIVPDEGVEGLVLSLSQKSWSGFESLPDGRVRVGAGLRLEEPLRPCCRSRALGFRVPGRDPRERGRRPAHERWRHGRMDLRRRRRGEADVHGRHGFHAPAVRDERGLPLLRRAAPGDRTWRRPSAPGAGGLECGGSADRRLSPQAARVPAARAQRRVHLQEPPRGVRRPTDRGERTEGRKGGGRGGVPGPRKFHREPGRRYERGRARTRPQGEGRGAQPPGASIWSPRCFSTARNGGTCCERTRDRGVRGRHVRGARGLRRLGKGMRRRPWPDPSRPDSSTSRRMRCPRDTTRRARWCSRRSTAPLGRTAACRGCWRRRAASYAGCDAASSRLTMDKELTKKAVSAKGVSVAHGIGL